MTQVFDAENDVHFGDVDAALPNWRKGRSIADPDDEQLSETPASVVAILGFDPLDEIPKKKKPSK